VKYSTTGGTATSGTDFTAVSNGTVTITAGNTTGTATVQVTGDTAPEPNESFTVTLSNPTNAAINDGSATGTIQNDDGPPPTPSMSIGDVTVSEGNSKTTPATFTVTLSSAAVGTVTAHYQTTDGSATAPDDYQSKSGTVTIGNGLTTGTITVNVVGDKLKEPDEAFTVTLSAPSGATINDGSATGTIHDLKDTCTIVGTNGDDTLNGTAGADTMCGLKGNDTLDGMGGPDQVLGAAGNDVLTGGTGPDTIKGAGGNDTLHGTDGVGGNDTVNGGSGTDTCDADGGDVKQSCP
jgi:Ca2+-binding RTX toxin-like protein